MTLKNVMSSSIFAITESLSKTKKGKAKSLSPSHYSKDSKKSADSNEIIDEPLFRQKKEQVFARAEENPQPSRERMQKLLDLHGNGLLFSEDQLDFICAVLKTAGGDPALSNQSSRGAAFAGRVQRVNQGGNPWGNPWSCKLWVDLGDYLGFPNSPLEFFEFVDQLLRLPKEKFNTDAKQIHETFVAIERENNPSTRSRAIPPPRCKPVNPQDKDGNGVPDVLEGGGFSGSSTEE